MVFCAVKNCNVAVGSKVTCPCLVYFFLPGEESLKLKWLEILDQQNGPHLSQDMLHVCSSHFERNEMVYTIHNKYELKSGAIPNVWRQHDFSNCLLFKDDSMNNPAHLNSNTQIENRIGSSLETGYEQGMCQSYTKPIDTNPYPMNTVIANENVSVNNTSTICTQTDFEEEHTNVVNMFFCTIHNDRDIETYCNLIANKDEVIESSNDIKTLNTSPIIVKESARIKNISKRKNEQKYTLKKKKKLNNEGKISVKMKKEMNENNVKLDQSNDNYDLPDDFDINNTEEYCSHQNSSDDLGVETKENSKIKQQPKTITAKYKRDIKSKNKNDEIYFNKMLTRFIAKLEKPSKKKCKREKNVKNSDNPPVFSCDLCPRSFTIRKNLNRHKSTAHSNTRHPCEYCEKTFNRTDALSIHLCKVHPDKADPDKLNAVRLAKNKVRVQGKHKCGFCGKYFVRQQNYLEHLATDIEPLKCNPCKKSFQCKRLLWLHENKQHAEPVSCDICHQVCFNKDRLNTHKKLHESNLECEVCNKKFSYKSTYNNHILTHSKERPFSCDLCGKTFNNAPRVVQHKWQVHQEKNKKHQCTICFKAFISKAKVECHMRTHTGEKPFLCDTCGDSFRQKCALKAHVRSVHGVYVPSVKEDGSVEMQLVKYKRATRKPNKQPMPEIPPIDASTAHNIPLPQDINLVNQNINAVDPNIHEVPIVTSSAIHPETSSNLNYFAQNTVQDLTTRTLQHNYNPCFPKYSPWKFNSYQ